VRFRRLRARVRPGGVVCMPAGPRSAVARLATCEADGLGLGSCGHACGRQFHAQLHSKLREIVSQKTKQLHEIPSQKESYVNGERLVSRRDVVILGYN